MNDYELLRIIEFTDSTRAPFVAHIPAIAPDSDWSITSHLVKAKLQQRDVTISQLIKVSGLAYGTAHRRIHQLIEQRLIDVAPASPGGKAHVLIASRELLERFERLALQVKSLITTLMGHRDDSQRSDQYYFGEPRGMLEQMLPPADLLTLRGGTSKRLKFLLHDDNYFAALRNLWIDFRANAGSSEDFRLAGLPELYEAALSNSARSESEFDIVALNYPWLAEFVRKELIAPLHDDSHPNYARVRDFHPAALECVTHEGRPYGLPMYVTVESLVARRDIFEANALAYPATLAELLAVARRLNKPRRGQYGIVWNAARGMPIASAFMFLLNAHGGAVLTDDDGCEWGRSTPSRPARAALDTDAAHATLAFMRELLAVSPPGTLSFDWEDSLTEFMTGRSALCYAWTMRAARLELDLRSKVKGMVKFLPHPNLRGVRRTAPLGGFFLAIPSNLPPRRAALAQQALRWLTSSEAMKSNAKDELPIAPRFSMSSDPDLDTISPIVSFVDKLARNGLICNTMRPLTPVYSRIEEMLGVDVHDALSGATSPETMLRNAQRKVQALLEAVGLAG
jgi:multiple sugar transport system substrate-binding protein